MSMDFDDPYTETWRDRGGSDDEDDDYHFPELDDSEDEENRKRRSGNDGVSYRGLYVGVFLLLVSLSLFARSMIKRGQASILLPYITLDGDNLINVYDQFSIPSLSVQIKKYSVNDFTHYFQSERVIHMSECSDTHIGASGGNKRKKKVQRSDADDAHSTSESSNRVNSTKTKLYSAAKSIYDSSSRKLSRVYSNMQNLGTTMKQFWKKKDRSDEKGGKSDDKEDDKELIEVLYDDTALQHQDLALSDAYLQYRDASQIVPALTLQDILPDMRANRTDIGNHTKSGNDTTTDTYEEEFEEKREERVYQALHAVSRKRYPKVLINALPSWWNSSSWSLWQLSRDFPVLKEVYILANASKQSHQQQQAPSGTARPLLFPVDAVAMVQMRYLDFLQSAQTNVATTSDGNRSSEESSSNRVSSALFYSCHYSEVQSVASPMMLPLAWQQLQIFDFDESTALSLKQRGIVLNNTQPQYWTLTTGAMQLKYSHYHRVLVQLSGTVEYMLFAPDSVFRKTKETEGNDSNINPNSMHAMGWYSALSHWDKISSEDLHRLPVLSEGKKRYRVRLEPGQVLYIPPLWAAYAQVQQGIPSVLEVPSISMEQLILAEAEYLKIPWRHIVMGIDGKTPIGDTNNDVDEEGAGEGGDLPIPIKERVIVAQVLLIHVLSRVKSIHTVMESPKRFGESLLSARMLSQHKELSWEDRIDVFTDTSTSTSSGGRRQGENIFTCYDAKKDKKSRSIGRFNQQLIVEHASFIASALEDVAIPLSARIMWLHGFTERVVQWVVNPTSSKDAPLEGEAFRSVMRHVIAFSEQCLNMSAFIAIEEDEEEGPEVIALDPSDE